MRRITFDKALQGLSRKAVVDVAWRHYRVIEPLEKVMKTCPVPDEDGYTDLGAMMTFCENVAALRSEEER